MERQRPAAGRVAGVLHPLRAGADPHSGHHHRRHLLREGGGAAGSDGPGQRAGGRKWGEGGPGNAGGSLQPVGERRRHRDRAHHLLPRRHRGVSRAANRAQRDLAGQAQGQCRHQGDAVSAAGVVRAGRRGRVRAPRVAAGERRALGPQPLHRHRRARHRAAVAGGEHGGLARRGDPAVRHDLPVPPRRGPAAARRVGRGTGDRRPLQHREVPDRPLPRHQRGGFDLWRGRIGGGAADLGVLLVPDRAAGRGVHPRVRRTIRRQAGAVGVRHEGSSAGGSGGKGGTADGGEGGTGTAGRRKGGRAERREEGRGRDSHIRSAGPPVRRSARSAGPPFRPSARPPSAPYRCVLPISLSPSSGAYSFSRSSSFRGSVSTTIISRCSCSRNPSSTAWSRNSIRRSK